MTTTVSTPVDEKNTSEDPFVVARQIVAKRISYSSDKYKELQNRRALARRYNGSQYGEHCTYK